MVIPKMARTTASLFGLIQSMIKKLSGIYNTTDSKISLFLLVLIILFPFGTARISHVIAKPALVPIISCIASNIPLEASKKKVRQVLHGFRHSRTSLSLVMTQELLSSLIS